MRLRIDKRLEMVQMAAKHLELQRNEVRDESEGLWRIRGKLKRGEGHGLGLPVSNVPYWQGDGGQQTGCKKGGKVIM